MIAPLRRRHRWLTTSLALAVPVLYVAALAGRQSAPTVDSLPADLTGGSVEGTEVVAAGIDFDGIPVSARLLRSAGGWMIELEPREALAKPEVLAYWAGESAVDGLPVDAHLLGAFGGTRSQLLAVPEAVRGKAGHLVLYSLGHQEVLASVALPAIGPTTEGETPAVPADGAGEGAAAAGADASEGGLP